MNRTTFLPRLRPVLLALMMASASAPALAQDNPVPIHIPAQPLSEALLKLAEQTQLQVFFSPSLVQGLSTTPIQGRMRPEEALRTLLQGSGLEYRRENNTITLSRPNADATMLAPVRVVGRRLPVTEGSQTYASHGATTTATKLNMTLRETPQTVSVMTRQRIEDQSLDNIGSVLQQAPGISIQHIGSDRYTIYSRGYAIDNYQLDGLSTLSDIVSQNIPQGLADMAIYDRVEVLRGASGLLTGAGDPSGVVNMVRKRPTADFQGHAEVGMAPGIRCGLKWI
ncbi:TonB-dependent siderophore receptor [Alcaligenes parafaecalis]|uniref:Secretin and TonB N-terminal domain-containing protein n=1 Tax=Alcaligenes parafaecalis TaxID=171260 RepID=A0ABT3VST2_9BURK|nr:TonB-dependent receptor plug domain-containing protein [Alcaligenes parafaecalis]MCX5465221.1 secretin and TonB N-terminal domain-containing protein [Alcaligenes parafaecalis]